MSRAIFGHQFCGELRGRRALGRLLVPQAETVTPRLLLLIYLILPYFLLSQHRDRCAVLAYLVGRLVDRTAARYVVARAVACIHSP